MKNKKIGVFDSGFGGLTILSGIRKALPDYDYIYLGDTARAPYGNRSAEQIYNFTCQAADYLFSKNCDLVLLACNTASAQALRKIQQEYLPKHHPGKNVLGVVVPTLEEIASDQNSKNVLVLATEATVRSESYPLEISKINKDINIFQKACPLLVPMIESGEQRRPFADVIISDYLSEVKPKEIDHLVLGCTHYGLIEDLIRSQIGSSVKITNQARIIPQKFKEYLENHPEFEMGLARDGSLMLCTTDITPGFETFARKLFPDAKIKSVTL